MSVSRYKVKSKEERRTHRVHGGQVVSRGKSIKPKITRGYKPKEEKIRVSNNTPDWFKEIVCGIMLSDGSIRMNGYQALMSIQQTHQ